MSLRKKESLDKTYLFEEMPVNKAIWTLALPTIINQLVIVVYNLADTFFIGKLNNASMTSALSVAAPIMSLLTAFGNLFTIGGSVLISRALGKKNQEQARKVALSCLMLALCIGIILSLGSLIFLEPLCRLAGASDTNIGYTMVYVRWAFVFNVIPNLCALTIGSSLRGRGFSKYEMFGLTLGNVINVVLDPIFIFVLDMGVKGAAVATFLSACISCLYFLVFLKTEGKEIHLYPSVKGFRPEGPMLKEIMLTGLPSAFNVFLNAAGNAMYLNCIKGYSDAAVAAAGITRKIENTTGKIIIGINQGVVPLVSYNYASKNYDRMESVRKRTMWYGIAWGFILIAILFPFPGMFIKAFINDADTIAYGTILLRIACFVPLFMNFNNATRTIMQALGRKKESIRISITRQLIIYIPLLAILAPKFGIIGASLASPLADFISDVIAYFQSKRMLKQIREEFTAKPEA